MLAHAIYYRLGHTLCVGLCVVLWRVDYIYKALSCCLHTRLEFSTPSPIVYIQRQSTREGQARADRKSSVIQQKRSS